MGNVTQFRQCFTPMEGWASFSDASKTMHGSVFTWGWTEFEAQGKKKTEFTQTA